MLNKIIYTILGFALAFIFFPHSAKDSKHPVLVSGASTQADQELVLNAPELAMSVPAPVISAKSAIAYDFDTDTVLYSKNLDDKLPVASLTKLMTALVVTKRFDLNKIIEIEKRDLTSTGSIIGFSVGEQVTIQDLLKALLIPSANDAALALANHTAGSSLEFTRLMNDEAREMGMVSTKFTNPVGWDIEENYSTTQDMAKIVQAVMKNNELAEIVRTKETTISSVDKAHNHKLITTNKLLLENREVVGIKTGFTSKALGNLIIMQNHNGRKVVTIVLGSTDREIDTQKLLNWLFTVYRW